MGMFIAAINTTRGACPWLKQPIPCDFGLYTNATSLKDSQKLLPNTDITGSKITILFLASALLAAILGFLLLVDEGLLLFANMDHHSNRYYRRLVHTIDTLLHSLSDSQIVAGLALLIVAIFHASCISVYHYNVICYLMVISMTIHLLAFINIPQVVGKNWIHAGVRFIAIVVTLAFTWILFKAREVTTSPFPVTANSLAIMPAACFVGNETTVLNSTFFQHSNMSQILGPSGQSDAGWLFNTQFLPIIIFGVAGLPVLGLDIAAGFEASGLPVRGTRIVLWVSRSLLTLALIVVAGVIAMNHFNLKAAFEVESWYLSAQEDSESIGQILMLTMTLTSALSVAGVLLGMLKTFPLHSHDANIRTESIGGPRSKEAVQKLLGALGKVKDNPSEIQAASEGGW